jgi:hypothetical protein
MRSREVAVGADLAKVGGSWENSSMPARYACPSSGAAKVETPMGIRNRA